MRAPGDRDDPELSRLVNRYSVGVGIVFIVLVVIAFVSLTASRESGTLGLGDTMVGEGLLPFAVPVATSRLDGDANVSPEACDVEGDNVIRVCDIFDRPSVISFWFSESGDCVTQQDVVDDVHRKFGGRVNFLSINVLDDRQHLRDLVNGRGWTMPVGYDRDGAVSGLYRVGGCPTFAYAYPGGVLQSSSVGVLDDAGLTARVEDLITASDKRGRS